jgi:hypothetical protein
VTDGGVVTVADESDSVTVAPPLGAGPLMATEHELDAPDAKLTGLQLMDVSVGAGGVNVIVTLRDPPFSVAVTVRVMLLGTALAVTVNVAVFDPPTSVTDPGVVT